VRRRCGAARRGRSGGWSQGCGWAGWRGRWEVAVVGRLAELTAEQESWLLQRGRAADRGWRGRWKKLARRLMAAASSGKRQNVRLLIAAGADVNARDESGTSVLAYAARHPDVVEELRRYGARR
jgi:hypothetical protein